MLHVVAVIAICLVIAGLPLLIIEGLHRDRRANKTDT